MLCRKMKLQVEGKGKGREDKSRRGESGIEKYEIRKKNEETREEKRER